MQLNKISDYLWEIPMTEKEGMKVPARIYATEKLVKEMDQGVFEQITNVATLPGIQQHALCMPDGHWGYGFPIGGVAAFDIENGIISPGGIGFDINCGMRLIRTDLRFSEVKPKLKELISLLFSKIPVGVGARGLVKLNREELDRVMINGAQWCIRKGFGWEQDRQRMEQSGCLPGGDPSKVSSHAVSRGIGQLGTLGSGNHYLEVQTAPGENVYDEQVARSLGIFGDDQVFVMVHCGSRGFGHQIGTDYLRIFDQAMSKYGIHVPDRQLACAPFQSPEGQDYYKAMICAANMAFANRQVITHRIREAFSQVFNEDAERLGMEIVYDVAHNVAKVEEFEVKGKQKKLLVHRKGSTRCLGPGNPEIPTLYRDTGQPVIVGGSMETGSYLCLGTELARTETFNSTMHGSGRTMSRTAAKHKVRGSELQQQMEQRGIIVKAASMAGLAEEAGIAYKDISEVVDTMDAVGVSKKVVRLKPIGNIKG
jgi:tRNA-splicing ligase RtcB (3'-phosphate/5'-hydroxy nucleic acid ligase)